MGMQGSFTLCACACLSIKRGQYKTERHMLCIKSIIFCVGGVN